MKHIKIQQIIKIFDAYSAINCYDPNIFVQKKKSRY